MKEFECRRFITCNTLFEPITQPLLFTGNVIGAPVQTAVVISFQRLIKTLGSAVPQLHLPSPRSSYIMCNGAHSNERYKAFFFCLITHVQSPAWGPILDLDRVLCGHNVFSSMNFPRFPRISPFE